MSTAPVTLLVARRVAAGRYRDFLAWQREGEALAADFPGYLGSGALAPPAGGDEFQMIFRFADDATLAAWAPPPRARPGSNAARGSSTNRAAPRHGLAAWFDDNRKPPRWKQSVAIWLAFFPVSLAFNLGAPTSASCRWPRGCCSAPWSSPVDDLLVHPSLQPPARPWLHRRPQRAASLPEAH